MFALQSQIVLIEGNVYDYPSYYDVLFNSSWKAEYRFLHHAFENFAKGRVRWVFEPACGTGRLLWRLAKDGFAVSGLDLNSKAVAFCNRRMRRHGLVPAAILGDIAVDLGLEEPIDAAFNLVSSFCHLTTEQQAEKHLRLIAEALRPGGVYLLGFHLKPRGVAECDSERWVCRRGSLGLSTELKSVAWDRRRRIETIEFRINAATPSRTVALFDRFPFRTYTLPQFRALLQKIESLELAATFDFSFEETELDDDSVDVVFVLKNR